MLSGKERNNFWKCRETVFYSKIQCSKIFFSNDLYKLSSWYRSNIRENEDLQAACNTNCSCGFDTYDPVCSEDDVTFFNPCVAGCLVEINDDVSIWFFFLKISDLNLLLVEGAEVSFCKGLKTLDELPNELKWQMPKW